MDGLKQWKCRNGHVLGVVRQVKHNGGRVARLMLFRHAIDMTKDTLENVDVLAYVEGTTLDVDCDVPGCGLKRSWFLGADATERLLERYSIRTDRQNPGGY
jgi:hypothetical protein